jgi:acyl carrier protein
MEREEIITKLTVIFRTVFNNQSIVISNEMTANDVENWDSLTHMLLINEVENSFSIKFKLKDLLNMKNVGELIDIIKTKIS